MDDRCGRFFKVVAEPQPPITTPPTPSTAYPALVGGDNTSQINLVNTVLGELVVFKYCEIAPPV